MLPSRDKVLTTQFQCKSVRPQNRHHHQYSRWWTQAHTTIKKKITLCPEHPSPHRQVHFFKTDMYVYRCALSYSYTAPLSGCHSTDLEDEVDSCPFPITDLSLITQPVNGYSVFLLSLQLTPVQTGGAIFWGESVSGQMARLKLWKMRAWAPNSLGLGSFLNLSGPLFQHQRNGLGIKYNHGCVQSTWHKGWHQLELSVCLDALLLSILTDMVKRAFKGSLQDTVGDGRQDHTFYLILSPPFLKFFPVSRDQKQQQNPKKGGTNIRTCRKGKVTK